MALIFGGAIVGDSRLGRAAPADYKPAPLVQTVGVFSVRFTYERTDTTDEKALGSSGHTVETWTASGHSMQRFLIQPTGEIAGSLAFAIGSLPATDPSPGGNKQAEFSGIHTYSNEHHEKDGSSVHERRFGNFDIQSTDANNTDAIHASIFSSEVDDKQCTIRFFVTGDYPEKTQINAEAAVRDRFDGPVRLVPVSRNSQQAFHISAEYQFEPTWPDEYAPAASRKIHESSCNLYGAFPSALFCSGAKTTYSPKGGWTVTFSSSQKNPNSKTTTINGGTTTNTGTEKITLSARLIPGNPAPAKMTIEPNDPKGYDDWLPIPASDDADVKKVYGDTQRLSFIATIKSREPGRDAPPGTIDFYLRNLSHNQGKCGNDSRAGGGDSDSPPVGLRFAKNQPGGITVDANDPTHAFTTDLVTSAMVTVEATDTGAYGRLYAESQELGINAVYERTNQLFVPVPRDDDNNHIAYAWEKSQNILGKGLPATSDDEDQPFPKHKGDGLSIYDQYRGFVVRLDDGKGNPIKKHQRIDVKSKNVFVMVKEDDTAAALIRQSAEHFGKITGFTIHFLSEDKELGFDDDQVGATPYPHWLNYNADPSLAAEGCPKQYAIWIMSKPPPDGNVYGRTVPIPPFNEEDSETPKNVDYIGIFRDNAKKRLDPLNADYPTLRQVAATKPDWYVNTRKAWDELHAAGQITDDFPAIAQNLKTNESALIDQFLEFCIIHEMSHATGVQHHHLKDALAAPSGQEQKFFAMGNADCPMRYWANDIKSCLLEYDGKWNVTNAPDGTPWKFCEEECQSQFHLRD